MATGVLLTPQIVQFFNNLGAPAVNGSVLTQVGGINTATYSDVALTVPLPNPIPLNSRGEVSTAAGVSSQCFLTPNTVYTFTLFDGPNGTGNQLNVATYVNGVQAPLTAGTIGQILYPRTSYEVTAAVTPTAFQYSPLTRLRYGSTSDWSATYRTISALSDTYDLGYRVDHAQHPSLTNAIAGFQSYDDSLQTGTVGYRCTAFGSQALQFNSSSVSAGGTNTAVGWASLQHNVEGSGNSAFGPLTLNSLTGINSSHNNAFGYRTFNALTAGTQNNGFGFQNGDVLTSGDNNHTFGENVLSHCVIGTGNHVYGYQCNYTKTAGDYTHAFGYQSLFSENAIPISGISKAASAVVTSNQVSVNNPFYFLSLIGFNGVAGMTQINGLTGTISAVGGVSGAWTATTDINSSGFSVYTSGGSCFPLGNTAFGYQTGTALTTAGSNTIYGWQAGFTNPPAAANCLFGFQAGFRLSTGGQLNCAFGWQALVNCLGGSSNACFGQQSGKSITTGTSNVCIGDNSGNGLSTASTNVCVGSITAINLNGDNNTCVGTNAGSQGSAQTFTNTSSFGKDATPTASNQVTLGNPSVATLRCQQTSITALSDARFKKNIRNLSPELPAEFLREVRIALFEWNEDDLQHHGVQVGVIAQELDALQTKYGVEWLGLVDKSNPDRWEATPGKLLLPLVDAHQKLALRVTDIENRLAA